MYSKQVHVRPSSGTAVYPHMQRAYLAVPRALAVSGGDWHLSAILAAARRFFRFWASEGAKFSKMGHSLPRTPINRSTINRSTKFDAASFILGGVIRNRTNTQTKNKNTYDRLQGRPYILHTCRSHVHPRDIDMARNYASSSHPELYFWVGARLVRFCASGGATFPKIGYSRPRTPINYCAKFDAASFILAGKIGSRTKYKVYKQTKNTNYITNSNRYIYTLPIGMCG